MTRRAKARFVLMAVLAAAATLAVWTAGFHGPYHFDDFVTPLDDPASHSLEDFGRAMGGTLRPVTKLTYALEASLGLQPVPAARRAVSAAIHAGSAAVLVLVLLTLLPQLGVAALPIALVWSVHPIHAEAILQVSGRTAALSGLLLLGALLAQLRGRRWLAASLLAAAALARETARSSPRMR